MGDYAQTNAQLYNQLRSSGYSEDDIFIIHKTYELAMELFTGLFRPSGKPFLNHLVGTASILVTLHAPCAVIAAALLHAAYENADFGTGTKGMTDENRKYLEQAVGHSIEELVAGYTELKWKTKLIPEISATVDRLTGIDRQVLLMRVANQLEDLLDFGILYHPDAESRKKHVQRSAPGLVKIANKLGAPSLALEIDKISSQICSMEIPANLRNTRIRRRRLRLKPLSDR